MQSRVLIIDENLVFLNGLKKFLLENHNNLHIHYSTTLSSLDELLSGFLPDKIIVDLKLIAKTSEENISLLFSQPQKLIFLTTFENETYPHLQKKYGDIPIFCKTTSIVQLKKTLLNS